ncbi:MAG: universal stress protein [Armatimonadetes bacterium]|nr:universal stress protein [Armatimonadota bacterium]
MYHRVLLPLDGSELALSALPHARHVSGSDTELLLLQVVSPVDTYFAPHGLDPEELRQTQLRAAREFLEQKKRDLEAEGLHARVLVLEGQAARCIVETATRETVDLVVLSSHGHSGLRRIFFGSVAQKVLRRAPCPVLVVRQGLAASPADRPG